MHSIELKFSIYIIGHRFTYSISFGEFRINNIFTGVQKRILIHYSLWSQIIRSMLVYVQCFLLRSNLICALQITVPHTILILAGAGCIVF